MREYKFSAVFEREDDKFNVSFPDIPSCYTCGDSFPDALRMAQDALVGWIARAEALGRPIPDATPLETIPQPQDGIVVRFTVNSAIPQKCNDNRRKAKKFARWLKYGRSKVKLKRKVREALKAPHTQIRFKFNFDPDE